MRPVNSAIPHRPPRSPVAAATALFLAAAAVFLPVPAATQSPTADGALPTIAGYTRGMDAQPGYFPLYWDDAGGRLLLEVGRWDEQFLYLTSLATGVGSNALGLDRGNIQSAYLAHFERVGPKVLLVLDNPGFRAETDPTDALVRSVEESFPTSTVGGFMAVAEERGRTLVDATSFFLRDVVGDCGPAAGGEPGQLPARCESQRHLPAPHEGVPGEHRGGGVAHLRERPARGRDPAPHTRRAGDDAAAASLAGDAPRRRLHAPALRPQDRGLRHRLLRLRQALRRRLPDGAGEASPAGQGRSGGGDERAGRADRLLPRSGGPEPYRRHSRSAGCGGTRSSRRPGSSTPSASRTCPRTWTRWTPATT